MLDALGDPGAAAVLYFNLGRLRHYGLLVAEVWRAGRLMATLLPRARNFDPVLKAEPSREWQLSRFAYLRRDGNDLLLECPEAPCVLQIQDIELVAWIAEAAGPVTAAPGTPKAEASALLGQLGFFVDPGEEEAPGQRTWEFHDRLFHRKARHFDDFQPHGGTYRFRGRFPSEPAIPPAYDGETARLPVPASRTGRPLREVMEARRSRRDMDDDRPVTRGPGGGTALPRRSGARDHRLGRTGMPAAVISVGRRDPRTGVLSRRPGRRRPDAGLLPLRRRRPRIDPVGGGPPAGCRHARRLRQRLGPAGSCRPSAWSSSPRACPGSPGSMRASPTRFP